MTTNSLIHYLANIPDPRHAKGIRHPQLSTLTIMVMAMLCGKTSLKGIARFARTHVERLAQYIPLPRNKPPSFSTIQRLSHQVDCEQVCEQFNRWMGQYTASETIAVDGKSIASTVTATADGKQTFTSLVSFFGQRSHLIRQVGQLENDQRSEIDLVQELLGTLRIERSVFTLDALHCQKKTVATIIEQGHGYLITVKQNQPTLYEAIARLSATPASDAWSWRQTGHGHDAQCRLKVWPADAAMQARWPGLRQYLSVRRQGEREGKAFDSTTYYITSESMSAWRLAQRVRGHRHIENTLHWSKDVVLHEDDCGLVASQSATNMALIRNMSMNLLVMAGYRSLSEGLDAMGAHIAKLWGMISAPAHRVVRFS